MVFTSTVDISAIVDNVPFPTNLEETHSFEVLQFPLDFHGLIEDS